MLKNFANGCNYFWSEIHWQIMSIKVYIKAGIVLSLLFFKRIFCNDDSQDTQAYTERIESVSYFLELHGCIKQS